MSPPHPATTVLVVEDEPSIADALALALRFNGFAVEVVGGVTAAREAMARRAIDLVLLDVLLPDGLGTDLCRSLRDSGSQVAVVFLTARDAPQDTVAGLTVGGDDYVTKPFSVDEVVARIRAVLRRTRVPAAPEIEDGPLRVADIELDEERYAVRRAERTVDLTATEFRLLRYLMVNADRVLTRGQILDHVWGHGFRGEPTIVDTYVSYLRRKLERHGPPLITTRRGIGYMLEDAAPEDGSPEDGSSRAGGRPEDGR